MPLESYHFESPLCFAMLIDKQKSYQTSSKACNVCLEICSQQGNISVIKNQYILDLNIVLKNYTKMNVVSDYF